MHITQGTKQDFKRRSDIWLHFNHLKKKAGGERREGKKEREREGGSEEDKKLRRSRRSCGNWEIWRFWFSLVLEKYVCAYVCECTYYTILLSIICTHTCNTTMKYNTYDYWSNLKTTNVWFYKSSQMLPFYIRNYINSILLFNNKEMEYPEYFI